MKKACVYGAGSFGTAVATVLAATFETVTLWGRDQALVTAINTQHENTNYLPGMKLLANIVGTTSVEEAARDAEVIVTATPSHATRELLALAARRMLPAPPESRCSIIRRCA